MMGHVCSKCMKIGGAIFLVLGILFLLRDLSIWDFWKIQWWTALILAIGIGSLGSAYCNDCKAIREGKKK